MSQDIIVNEKDLELFWSRVIIDPNTGCWIYEEPRHTQGYGLLGVHGEQYYAHRVSYTIHYGPIPYKMEVCHSCDNPPCVKPKHLFLGSRKENAYDSVRKGRQDPRDGENNPAARLTWSDVEWIRKVYLLEAEFTQANLAKLFGVTNATISNVINNRTWVPK